MSKRWSGKTVIGLTGNIATGKSVVRRMLEHLGAFSIDADSLAHRAMSPGAPAYQPVIELFGKFILDADGRINRQRLGRVVFNDPEALAALERIVHPIVVDVIGLLIRRAGQPVVVIEAIKLFESGLAAACDSVWVVDAPQDVQIRRLMSTRGMSEAEARTRITAQPPQAEKLARASVVIDNSGGYEQTFEQVQRHLAALTGVHVEEPEPEPELAPPSQPAPTSQAAPIRVQRAGPRQAEAIARFINAVQGTSLTRADVLVRFGQRAYMLAYAGEQVVGLAGWQVENLVTRVTEIILADSLPPERVITALVEAVEQASMDLQSEMALLFVAQDTSEALRRTLQRSSYEQHVPADFRVPDWREAAEESMPPGTVLFAKRLRADRVLRPI
ncbi:MAG: hypothetical protein Kow00124_15210 [Anaerolineae bacterium]